MAIPNSRATLGEWCLRKLGKGANIINVTADQLDDRIDEALMLFQEWHYDATEELWVTHSLNQTDIDNGYIILDDSFLTVSEIKMYSQQYYQSGEPLFDFNYQVALSELDLFNPVDQINYFMTITNYEQIMDLTEAVPTFKYSRHQNKLMINTDIANYRVGYPVIMRVFKLIDPSSCSKIYGDRWLMNYSTALIKKQWAENLMKFGGVQLAGGITLNADALYQQASEEITNLEQQLHDFYSEPIDFMIG